MSWHLYNQSLAGWCEILLGFGMIDNWESYVFYYNWTLNTIDNYIIILFGSNMKYIQLIMTVYKKNNYIDIKYIFFKKIGTN